MAATYIVGPSSSVAATAVLTTKTSRCPALPHLPPRLSSPSFGTSLKHSSGTKSFFFFNYFLLCAVKNSWKQCGILYGTGSCISSVRVGGLQRQHFVAKMTWLYALAKRNKGEKGKFILNSLQMGQLMRFFLLFYPHYFPMLSLLAVTGNGNKSSFHISYLCFYVALVRTLVFFY